MLTIPKVYIALRKMSDDPVGLEKTIRDRRKDAAEHIPRAKESLPIVIEPYSEITFLTTRELLTDPPGPLFLDLNTPTFIVMDVEDVKPDDLSTLKSRESFFKQNFDPVDRKPRIVIFKDVIPESLLLKQEFLPHTQVLGKMPTIEQAFSDYRDMLEGGLAVRAQSFNAAVDIAFANIINSNKTSSQRFAHV